MARLRSRVLNMDIPPLDNPRDATQLISTIDHFYSIVKLDFSILEAEKERLESIVRQYERVKAIGKNDDDRKRNASTFLENFPEADGTTVDIYDRYRKVSRRYGFLRHALDLIESKQSKLITISGYMKIDASFTKYA